MGNLVLDLCQIRLGGDRFGHCVMNRVAEYLGLHAAWGRIAFEPRHESQFFMDDGHRESGKSAL